jgi:hypothetical protein
VATATPAQAYTCSGWYYNYLSDGSAAASIHFGIYCSDARSHVYGTVYDIKCDARSAYLHLRFYNGSNAVAYRNEYPSDGNGCGSSATFSYSSTNTRPYLYGCVYAANGGPTQSSGDCDWIGGNQP